MRTADPSKFLEIYYSVENFKTVFESVKDDASYAHKDQAADMEANINLIEKFYAYKML